MTISMQVIIHHFFLKVTKSKDKTKNMCVQKFIFFLFTKYSTYAHCYVDRE